MIARSGFGELAQAKMSKTKVLYIHVTGVSSEVLKNLVLAGIRALCATIAPILKPSWTVLFLSAQDRIVALPILSPLPKSQKYGTVAEAVWHRRGGNPNPLLGPQTSFPPRCELTSDLCRNLVSSSRHDCAMRFASPRQPLLPAENFTWRIVLVCSSFAFDLGKKSYLPSRKGKGTLDPKILEPYVDLEIRFG
jgi:hypothetical protein